MAYNQFYSNSYKNLLNNTTSILPKAYTNFKPRSTFYDVPIERTLLDRGFDVLNVGQYATMGLIRGLIDNELNPIEGFIKGLAAANPFGDGHEEWEYNFSGVLEEAGWQPETTGGKIARGAVGFLGDVFLDPLTYVSGGMSGLVKGTGKHSAKAALGVTDDVFEAAAKMGFTAGKSAAGAKTVSGTADALRMTQEAAEEIIKRSKVFQSGKVGTNLAEEATELMNKYNKLIGINDKVSDVVFSLANAPFGKKIFGDAANKSFTLIDSDVMKAIGDKTFAPLYGKMRDKIYGGQIGKLFSTSHTLYKFAQSDPEQVYNFIKKVDLDIGLAKERASMAEVIKKNADLLGDLTPAQHKEIVDALEDKTIWSKVKKTINFIDTKEATRYKSQLEKSRNLANQKIDELINSMDKTKEELAKTTLSINDQDKVLDLLKNEYISELITLNENHVVDLGRTNEVIDEILKANNVVKDFDITNIKKTGSTVQEQIEQIMNHVNKPNGIDRDKLVDNFYELIPGLKRRSDDISAAKDLIEETTSSLNKPISFDTDVEAFKDFVNKVEKPHNITDYMFKKIQKDGFYSSRRADHIKKVTDAFPDWVVTKSEDGITRIFPPINPYQVGRDLRPSAVSPEVIELIDEIDKPKFIDDLSTYLFGNKGFISLSTSDRDLHSIVKMIEQGVPDDQIIKYVYDKKELYNGAAKEMWSFIASEVGYDNWSDYYEKGMSDLLEQQWVYEEALEKGIKGIPKPDQAKIIKLEKANLKREYLKRMFDGKTSTHEVNEVINNIKDARNTRSWEDFLDDMYNKGIRGETLQSGGNLDELKRDAWNIERFMRESTTSTQRQFHKNPIGDTFKLSKRERDIAYDYYTQTRGKKVELANIKEAQTWNKNIHKQINMYAEQITDYKKQVKFYDEEIENLLKNRSANLNFAEEMGVKRRKRNELLEQINKAESMSSKLQGKLKPTHDMQMSSPLQKNIFDKYIENVEEMLSENQKNFGMLSEDQRRATFDNAVKRFEGKSRKEQADAVKNWGKGNDKAAKAIDDMDKINAARRKAKVKRKVFDGLKRNSRVEFLHDGKKVIGVVDSVDFIDGKKILNVTFDGTSKQITVNSFLGRLSDSKPRNLDDIVDASELHKEFLDARKQNIKRLERLQKSKSNLSDAYKTNIDEIVSKYNKSVNDVHNETLKLNSELEKIKSKLDSPDINKKFDVFKSEYDKYNNLLNNADAFETYVRSLGVLDDSHVDDVLNKYNPNLGEYILRDDLEFDDAVRNTIESIRKEFIDMGLDEVAIGKLSKAQLDELMYEYVPRILTPEGEKFFADKRNTDVFKHLENFGSDFGYGREFNPYSKSRKITKIPTPDGSGWIENPTISQINEHFKQFTDGKNVFSENLADIYIQRALKHNDLMYDNKYMEDMFDIFGEDYTGEIKEGFSTVMNYGMLKKYSSDVVRMNTRLDISEMISRHLDEADVFSKINAEVQEVMATNYANLVTDSKDYILREKQIFNERISKYIDSFLQTKLPDSVRKEMYMNNLGNFTKHTNTTGMLDDIAVPLGQLDDVQIGGLNNQFDVLKSRYAEHIKDRFYKNLGFTQKYVDEVSPGKSLEQFVFGNITDVDEQMKRVGEWTTSIINDAKDKGNYVDFMFGNHERLLSKLDDMSSIQPPQIKQINDAIVQKANQARKLQIIKDNNHFLDIYDKITHFIKLNQTAILPSFHSRNFMSNKFSNWLEIGVDAYDVDFNKKTLKAMKGELVEEMFEVVGKDGKVTKIKWSDLYDAAVDYGAIDSGVFAKDVGVGKTGKGLFDGKIAGKFDPTNTKEFIGYTYGTKIGNQVENHDRFIHFASQVSRGHSFKEAAESVNKFLFDYSDLTIFEQGVMRRIFPYYTWLRKNAPLQLEMMLEKPDKYRMIAKVIGGLEGMVDEEDRVDKRFVNDFAKNWVQLPFYVTNPEGRREPVLWNPNLPFMDINRIPDITRTVDSLRDLFTQTNPMIKVPIEQILNKNVFFDSPIVKEGQSQIGRRIDHVGKQFGAYPVIEGIANKSGLDFGLHLLNSTSGVKLLSYDYDAYKAMKIGELNKKKANSNSNPGILDSIKRRLSGY